MRSIQSFTAGCCKSRNAWGRYYGCFLSSSSFSIDWLERGTSGLPAGVTSQVPFTTQEGFGLERSEFTPSTSPKLQATTALTQPAAPKPNDATLMANQVGAKDSKASTISGNGFVPDPIFGDVFSATSVQVKQNSLIPSSASGVPVSSAIVPASSGPQTTVRPSPLGPLQCTLTQQSIGSQNQQVQSPVNQNQQVLGQSSNAFPGGAGNSASVQPHLQWPKITQAAVKKYSKVFVEVDMTDMEKSLENRHVTCS